MTLVQNFESQNRNQKVDAKKSALLDFPTSGAVLTKRIAHFLTSLEWLWPSWPKALHHDSANAIASAAATA